MTSTQVLSCQICKIFKKTSLEEHLQTTASIPSWLRVSPHDTIISVSRSGFLSCSGYCLVNVAVIMTVIITISVTITIIAK